MAIYLLSILYVAITVTPIINHDGWWIRIFEFPRTQILFCGVCIILIGLFLSDKNLYYYFSLIMVSLCLVYQLVKIFPYTFLYPVQMVGDNKNTSSEVVKLMIANVFMDNKNYNGLMNLVNTYNPDILLVLETNNMWYENLNLKPKYLYEIAEPLENTYGMILYSKFQLKSGSIEHLVEDNLPSIHAEIKLPSGKLISIHCLHPKPPAPQESTQTTERDAELLIVGKRAKNNDMPTIVAGDLNDVAWSYTTNLFQKISGLLDPRIGRGMYSTFHVKVPFFRFPLDHAFASKEFTLRKLSRLPSFGSDHFPIYIELSIDNKHSKDQELPKAKQADNDEANSKIEEALT